MASVRDLLIDAGTTIRWSLVWRKPVPANAPVGSLGEPYDLNSATARMQLRKKPNRKGEVLLELDEHGLEGDTGLYLGGETGLIVINITAVDTQEKLGDTRRVFYDLFVTLANGETHKVLQGKIKVVPNVTSPSSTYYATGA